MGDSMSSVVISGDTSGAITLAAPAVAGTNTITLPNATGTAMVSGNMPAFSAYGNADVSVATSTYVKVTYPVEDYDTASYYDTSNSRFTPLVAGYYDIHAYFEWQGYAITNTLFSLNIFKNGGLWKRFQSGPSSGGNWGLQGNGIVYMNGSTDYLEIYANQATGSTMTIYNGNGQSFSSFQGVLVRSA
jgi:hypothetical protein